MHLLWEAGVLTDLVVSEYIDFNKLTITMYIDMIHTKFDNEEETSIKAKGVAF